MIIKNKFITIIILFTAIFGLLLLIVYSLRPNLNSPPRPAHLSIQRTQFYSVDNGIEKFKSDFNIYPSSGALDPTNKPYCGAMKLTEAMLGMDLKGFHRDSVFRADGMNEDGTIKLYSDDVGLYDPNHRKGPYLLFENANSNKLNKIFVDVEPFNGNIYVICDMYRQQRHSGKNVGMPVLYYKADTTKTAHDVNNPDNPDNIYNYKDNYDLLALGVPGKPQKKHPLFKDPTIFYKMTRDYRDTKQIKPVNPDSFILLSAGKDGLYGTEDDLGNFHIGKWK